MVLQNLVRPTAFTLLLCTRRVHGAARPNSAATWIVKQCGQEMFLTYAASAQQHRGSATTITAETTSPKSEDRRQTSPLYEVECF